MAIGERQSKQRQSGTPRNGRHTAPPFTATAGSPGHHPAWLITLDLRLRSMFLVHCTILPVSVSQAAHSHNP
jgi:hypothetical protein